MTTIKHDNAKGAPVERRVMRQIIESSCQCGEPVLIETGRFDVCRRDGKRPHHQGSNYMTTQFRCRKCHKWLADSCEGAAFGENIR